MILLSPKNQRGLYTFGDMYDFVIPQNNEFTIEPRKQPSYFPLYWLVNSYPYFMVY